MSPEKHRTHAALQKSYFDRLADLFTTAIPEDVKSRTREIVLAAHLNEGTRVLDVGTGTGALIYHFLEAGVPSQNILGCDLSSGMLEAARNRFTQCNFWQGDFLEFPNTFGLFDIIFINSCFGNFFDQSKVIERCSTLLHKSGQLIISHPMGKDFVAQLHDQEPEIVPHQLPNKEKLCNWAETFGFTLEMYRDEPLIYLAALRKQAP